jgi:hypothetical protein
MKIKQIIESTGGTTAGAIASVASPIGATQKRAGSLFKGKKTKKKFYEGEMKRIATDMDELSDVAFKKKYGKTKEEMRRGLREEEIIEADLILMPGQLKGKDKSFIPHDKDRRDHEVEMARSELFAAAKDAQRIYKMIQNRTEDEGLMGWQQSYITLAADYLNSVADSLEHRAATEGAGVIAGGMSNFEESTQKVDSLVTDALKIMKSPEMQDAVKALKTVLGHREYNSRPRFYQFYVQQLMDMYDKQDVNEISDFKRKELERELAHEKNNYAVAIDGKTWKVFADEQQAKNIARSLQRKGKNATVYLTGANVSESKKHKCPECGGEMVSEELMNEKKDACYYKVKSRYKVWPSAYASGALVKCRKKGSKNWGNKSK